MWVPRDDDVLPYISESRFSMFVHRYLSNPRLILFSFGVLMSAITVSTYLVEPGYLVWPWLYIVAGAAGAISSFWAMISPGRWSLAMAGSLIAGAVAARGIGLMLTVIEGPWRGDLGWTLVVGALAYFVILTMLPPVWLRYLIPWAVEKVR